MNIPGKQELLHILDTQSHRGRVSHMSLLGYEHAGTAALNTLLDALQQGGTYEQQLVMYAATAACDESRILAGFQSKSVIIQRCAASASHVVSDDHALAAVILNASPHIRRALLNKVVRQNRTALAELLYPAIQARMGVKAATALLPACTAETLQQALAGQGECITNWRLIARRHPNILLDYMATIFSQVVTRKLEAKWYQFASAWKFLILERPRKVLQLLKKYHTPSTRSSYYSRDCLGMPHEILALLTPYAPDEIVDLLLLPEYHEHLQQSGLPKPVLKAFPRLSSEQQTALLKQLVNEPEFVAQGLAKLPPSQRAQRFAAVYEGVDTEYTLWPGELLETLPHVLRDTLAKQQLTLKKVQEFSDKTLTTTAFINIETARPILEKAAHSAGADKRSDGLSLLIACTARYRRGLTETLTFLHRLKNEQDPVRRSAWEALSEVPVRLFQNEHAPLLDEQINYVVEARDTSAATCAAIRSLALSLLVTQADEPESPLFKTALSMLQRLAKYAGTLSFPPLHSKLMPGTEHALVEALLPTIKAFDQLEQPNLLLSLTEALGKRAATIPSLQEELGKLLGSLKGFHKYGLASRAVRLWLEPRKTRDARIRQLLDKDLSFITFNEVQHHLLCVRQDWLDPFLTLTPIDGEFVSGKTISLLQVNNDLHTWLPRQQHAFAQLQQACLNDTAQAERRYHQSMRTLALIPSSSVDTITPYLNHDKVNIQEAALASLSRLDRPDTALPVLSQYLNDDRARVAMYAFPRCGRLVAPSTLIAALKGVLQRDKLKITVRKEAIRLLGTFPSPDSMPLLQQQWDRPQVHRDVKIAIGHAARHLLHEEQAWSLLEQLASQENADIARSLFAASDVRLSRVGRKRYANLLLGMATHPDADIRGGLFAALNPWIEGAEQEIASVAAYRVTTLENNTQWRHAWEVLLTCCQDEPTLVSGELKQVVQQLMAVPVTDANNAMPECDLPARQRLLVICDGLCALPDTVRMSLRDMLEQLAEQYSQDAALWLQTTALRLACLPSWVTAPEQCAEGLIELAHEAQAQPLFIAEFCRLVERFLKQSAGVAEEAVVLNVVDALVSDTSEVSALLALEVLKYASGYHQSAGNHFSRLLRMPGRQAVTWPEHYASRLRALREHTSVGVCAAASKVWVCRE